MEKPKRFTMHDVHKHFASQGLVNAVTSPSARTGIMLQPNTPSVAHQLNIDTILSDCKDLIVIDKAVIELMYMWGLRITEVLNITCSDVSRTGNIRIKALKGSNYRVIRSARYESFWIHANNSILPINSVYSRFYFYRLFKRIGIYGKFGSNENNSVTHYFRHAQGIDVQNTFENWELTASALGHKHIQSTQYYAKKER